MLIRYSLIISIVFTLFCGPVSSLRASFIFNVTQVGANVVTTGSGTINTSSLTLIGNNQVGGAYAIPDEAVLIGGPVAYVQDEIYKGITGPSAIGSGGPSGFPIAATSGGGDLVGIAGGTTLLVSVGYISGAPLSNTDTYSNQTLSSLGYTSGTYVYTWGSGATADSLTVNVGPVPEPGSLAVVGLPAAVALLRRRRGLR